MSLYLGEKLISGIGQDRIADTLPIGAIIEWDSDLIPENWLLLNGQAVSRTVYSELFAIYGTTYGAGDGSTTFNLPDRRTRVAVGRDANDEDFAALGITGGEKEHTLTVGEMPKHNHGIAVNGTGGSYSSGISYTSNGVSNVSFCEYTGNDQPHNNLQPYIVTNFIVKAKLYTTEFIGGNMVIDNLTSDSSVNVLSARMGKELDAKKFDKGEVIDYIVEEGTEGIWTWRKWNSGVAECWGTHLQSVIINYAWGSLYVGSVPAQNYPSGLFVSVTSLQKTVQNVNGYSCWIASYDQEATTAASTSPTGLLRPTAMTNSASFRLHYNVKGRWK